MMGGFGLEEVKKLLLCGTLRAGSDDAKHKLERKWRKHDVVIFMRFFGEQMVGDGERNVGLVGS